MKIFIEIAMNKHAYNILFGYLLDSVIINTNDDDDYDYIIQQQFST